MSDTTTVETDTESDDDYAQQQLAEAGSQNDQGADGASGDTSDDKDYRAEADKWKALARKHELESRARDKRLKDIEDKDKSELQKLNDKLSEREVELSELRVAAVRRDAAEAANLPPKFAKFINATDAAEALAQAKELAKALTPDEKQNTQRGTDFKQGARGGNGAAGKPLDNNELLRRMAAQGSF